MYKPDFNKLYIVILTLINVVAFFILGDPSSYVYTYQAFIIFAWILVIMLSVIVISSIVKNCCGDRQSHGGTTTVIQAAYTPVTVIHDV